MAAVAVLRSKRDSPLRAWGLSIAGRSGNMKAYIAVARKLAVTLHGMWVTGTEYRWHAES